MEPKVKISYLPTLEALVVRSRYGFVILKFLIAGFSGRKAVVCMSVQIPVLSDAFHYLMSYDIALGLSLAKSIWQQGGFLDPVQHGGTERFLLDQ
jgi:hypothetical protein